MKKVMLLLAGSFFVMPIANATEITSRVVDSVQLTVDGPALQTTRIGSSYSVSGTNISATTLGGLTRPQQVTRELNTGVNTDPMEIRQGDYSIASDGDAFTFTETAMVGDVPITDQATLSSNGRFAEPILYGDSLTMVGGSVGDLAGSLGGTHGGTVPQVTAGGVGTSAIGQRTVELSVFR